MKSKIYMNSLYNSISNKKKKPEDLSIHFFKDMQMGNRKMKRWSTSLIIREKVNQNYNGKDVEEMVSLCPFGENVVLCSHYGNQYGISSKS